MAERTNEEWLNALQGPAPDAALSDLRTVLLRGLHGALGSRDDVAAADLEDFAQDALLKIMASLDGFRGDSRFTTWAQKIAVHTALTELRRKRWRDWSLDKMGEGPAGESIDYTPRFLVDPADTPEQQAVQQTLLEVVRRTMAEKLTERQRTALVAIRVQGIPMDQVAAELGTNRNALYKLLHDARMRLKSELAATGLSVDEILAAFEK
jgi:RNA polymerase sigma-70 factor (ECF subfamily)